MQLGRATALRSGRDLTSKTWPLVQGSKTSTAALAFAALTQTPAARAVLARQGLWAD